MLRHNSLKIFLAFVFLLLGAASWAGEDAARITVFGLSFDRPAGWEVTETQDYGPSKYISVEKKGYNSSGLVIITFTDRNSKPREYLEVHQKSFLNQKIMKELVFSEAKEEYYGKHKGIASSYTFQIASVKHAGKIYVFNTNGMTVSVVHQEAIEDHAANRPGFETIMKSLSF